MNFQIGDVILGSPDGPDPGPKDATWHLAHVVEVKQIPGKGKKFITVRTSDAYSPTTGPLWECDLTIRSITMKQYAILKTLCELGGPFMVKCNHGNLKMYIVDCSINHGENDKEFPLKVDPGLYGPGTDADYLNVATWTIKLQEAHD